MGHTKIHEKWGCPGHFWSNGEFNFENEKILGWDWISKLEQKQKKLAGFYDELDTGDRGGESIFRRVRGLNTEKFIGAWMNNLKEEMEKGEMEFCEQIYVIIMGTWNRLQFTKGGSDL